MQATAAVVAPTRSPWGGRVLENGWAEPKEPAGGRSLARRSTRLGTHLVAGPEGCQWISTWSASGAGRSGLALILCRVLQSRRKRPGNISIVDGSPITHGSAEQGRSWPVHRRLRP